MTYRWLAAMGLLALGACSNPSGDEAATAAEETAGEAAEDNTGGIIDKVTVLGIAQRE